MAEVKSVEFFEIASDSKGGKLADEFKFIVDRFSAFWVDVF
jgi:hypothetical protein